MKRRRTDDPDICFTEADPVMLWTLGIVEWKIDTRNRKSPMIPIMRDGGEGPVADVAEAYERFLRENREL